MAYVNPFQDLVGITPERIDMGVDYAAAHDSPLVALGAGRIWLARVNADTGWPGNGFVGLQLADGAYAGKHIFYAEHITPLVVTGATVHAGQPLATLHPGMPNCEVGWGTGSWTSTLAHALGQVPRPPNDPGGWPSACGASFATLCVALGAPRPIKWGQTAHGVMPPGYPPIYDLTPVDVWPLKVGSQDSPGVGGHVHQVQRALQARGRDIKADGQYGPLTEGAVTAWQHNHGRKATGLVGSEDWAWMFPLLHPGTNKAWPGATTALQHAFNNLHESSGGKEDDIPVAVDGDYGPGMVHATGVFQSRHGLGLDGQVGPKTWTTLFE